jgi:hypothetical protein
MPVNSDHSSDGGPDSGADTDGTLAYGSVSGSEGTVAYGSGSGSAYDPVDDLIMYDLIMYAFSPAYAAAHRKCMAQCANIARWKRHEAEVCACGMKSRCWRLRKEATCWYMDMKQAREDAR